MIRCPLHHIGIVVPEIEAAIGFYEGLGFSREGSVVADPVQKVKIQFMRDAAEASRIELLEPSGPDSPVAAALQKGGGLNHLCYQVADIEEAVSSFKKLGSAVISEAVPAPAISSCRVIFLFHRRHGVFELVESPATIRSGVSTPAGEPARPHSR